MNLKARNIFGILKNMIQLGSKSLKHLKPLGSERDDSLGKKSVGSLNSPIRNRLRTKTPLRQRGDSAETIQHYYSVKNIALVSPQKVFQIPERLNTPLRSKSRKLRNGAAETKQSKGSASQQKFQKFKIQKNTFLKPQQQRLALKMTKTFASKGSPALIQKNPVKPQIKKMAQQIKKLKQQNEKLAKLYQNVKKQKEFESKKVKNYEIQLEEKNILLKKRIDTLNSQLRQLTPHEKTIYHLETYRRVAHELYSPAFVTQRIEETTPSMEESLQKALSIMRNQKFDQMSQYYQTTSQSDKKDELSTSDLSLQSQKCYQITSDL